MSVASTATPQRRQDSPEAMYSLMPVMQQIFETRNTSDECREDC